MLKLKLLICNWKSNKKLEEVLKDKKQIENTLIENIKLVICPSYPYLPIMHSRKYAIGAQDVSEFSCGNYTGEVSAEILKSLDVQYVIIGHNEREIYFLETPEKQKMKIMNALKENLKVILPIGETLLEYQLDKTEEVLEQKLSSLLISIPKEKRQNIAIAYEPIWRIGKNIPINKKEIIKVILFIKHWLLNHGYQNTPVLFGGGVQEEDIKNLSEIDGFLLGTMSLNVEKLCKVLENFQESTRIYKT